MDPALAAALQQLVQVATVSQNTLNQILSAQQAQQAQPAPAAPQPAPTLTATVNTKDSTMPRPAPFKGGAKDARRFLRYFNLWAGAQGMPLNDTDPSNGRKAMRPADWISHALAFMEGEAALWALPYLKKIEDHVDSAQKHRTDTSVVVSDYPFDNGNWESFKKAFSDRFQAIDDSLAATRELVALTQGKQSAAEYAARFQEIAGRTNFSDADLQVRFRSGLNPATQLLLAQGTLDAATRPTTLDELIARIVALEAHIASITGRGPTVNPPNTSSTRRDPYAMEIDATRTTGRGRTREDYFAAMSRRCFGCGGEGHSKRDCTATQKIICPYCGRRGHKEAVCQDKFTGVPRGRGRNSARVAATSTTPTTEFSLFPEEAPAASTSTAPVATSNNPAPDLSTIVNLLNTHSQILSSLPAAIAATRQDF